MKIDLWYRVHIQIEEILTYKDQRPSKTTLLFKGSGSLLSPKLLRDVYVNYPEGAEPRISRASAEFVKREFIDLAHMPLWPDFAWECHLLE